VTDVPPSEPTPPARDTLGVLLLGLVPLALALEVAGAPPSARFLVAVLAIVPLAKLLGKATEEIALRSTSAVAALLHATFGNATELLVCARLLLGPSEDGARLVRASIVGTLVTNLLLLIGLAMFAGGLKFKQQRFNPVAAGVSASLLIIAFAGVSLPTLYGRFVDPSRVLALSGAVSVVMALIYIAGVLFTVVTHNHLFDVTDEVGRVAKPEWSVRRSIGVLLGCVVSIGWLAGILESTVHDACAGLGLSPSFVGVIVLGLLTNVAENLSAISWARRDMLDISIQIGTSSVNQIMLFVVPILVAIGALSGRPFALDFTGFELACMFLPVIILNHLAADGQCNWLEGLELIGLYAIIGTCFFFVP
jgi:Ca2+:H+ antiporter